nr:hypothetical protein Iba_chr02aCG14810 [Ipomoea batatas]
MIFATQHLNEIPRRFPFIPHRRRVPASFRRAPVINVKHWANSPADLPPPAKHYPASTSSDQAPTNTNSESDEASCNPEIGCSSGAAICHSLTLRPGAGIGHLVGKQGHHDGKVRLLEALGQGCVNLLLDSSAARREGPLPINPSQFVPDLRVDEGSEELLGYDLVGADEPSKATGILHLVNGLRRVSTRRPLGRGG